MHSCPDLAYLVWVLSCFGSHPKPRHIELVKYVLRYVSETLDLGLTFDGKANIPDDMIGYTDSDFAGSKTNRKSIRGYVFMFVEAAISHSSKLQSIVALSTCKAKYVVMCEVRKEAI